MRYTVGDIHGCYSKLVSVLDSVNFDPKKDILYSVGDFADRGNPEEIAETLLYLNLLHKDYPQSFQPVFGNHDIWLYLYLESIFNENKPIDRDFWDVWMHNGGRDTINALKLIPEDVQRSLYDWMKDIPYRIDLDDFVIQHTTTRYDDLFKGINPVDLTLKQCLDEEICSKDYDVWFWDRYVLFSSTSIFGEKAAPLLGQSYTATNKPLIIGHTPLLDGPYFDKDLNIISIDTGSFVIKERYNVKKDGEVCILNLDTLEWIKSDNQKGVFNV